MHYDVKAFKNMEIKLSNNYKKKKENSKNSKVIYIFLILKV